MADEREAAAEAKAGGAVQSESEVAWRVFPGTRGAGGRRGAPVESGQDIRTVQGLLGHADVSTTMVYTHVLNRGPMGVVSPLDTL